MQKENGGRLGIACFAIKDFETVHVSGLVGDGCCFHKDEFESVEECNCLLLYLHVTYLPIGVTCQIKFRRLFWARQPGWPAPATPRPHAEPKQANSYRVYCSPLIPASAIAELVDEDGTQQNCTAYDILVKRIDVQKVHNVFRGSHNQHSNQHAGDRCTAAH
jgi:hypothetical protein